jgi:hypothetical protein
LQIPHPALTDILLNTSSGSLCEENGRSGRNLIEAMVAGYEASMRVNDAISFIERGFHPLCAASYGIPLIAGKIWGLPKEAIANAVGISGARGFTSFVVNSGAISMMKAMGLAATAAGRACQDRTFVQSSRQEYRHDQTSIATAPAHDRRYEDSQHVAEYPKYLYLRRCQIQRLSSTLSGQARPGGYPQLSPASCLSQTQADYDQPNHGGVAVFLRNPSRTDRPAPEFAPSLHYLVQVLSAVKAVSADACVG